MINILNAYQIMGKVAYEIEVLVDKIKTGKHVKIVGYPDEISPQHLIIYQWEKIYTVENALKLPEQHTRDYIKLLNDSLCTSCKQGNTPCLKDLEKKIKLEILKELIT